MKSFAAAATLLVLASFAFSPAVAQVDVVNNLANAVNSHSSGLNANTYLAEGFTTGSSGGTLSSVDWSSRNNGLNGIVHLFSNGAGQPGSDLGFAFTNNGVTGAVNGQNIIDFTPNSTVTLAGNTTYWVTISGGGDINSTTNQTWTGNGTLLTGTFVSGNSGVTWANVSPTENWQVRVRLTPSPVPAAPVVLLIGAAVFGLGMRKRRRSES